MRCALQGAGIKFDHMQEGAAAASLVIHPRC
jgi:hypothetical protein